MNSPFDAHNGAAPQPHAQLVELAGKLSDREIYTADREQLITGLASRRFQFKTIVHQVTKSYVSDLDSHRDGMTVEGVLLTTDIAVQVQFPAELNELISILQPGESVLVDGVLNRWMTGLDRLEFWSGYPRTETLDAAAVDATPTPVVADTTLANSAPGETADDVVEPPPPPAPDKSAEPPAHLDIRNDATPPTESTAGTTNGVASVESHQEPLTSDSGTAPDAPAFPVAIAADDAIGEMSAEDKQAAPQGEKSEGNAADARAVDEGDTAEDDTQHMPAARKAFAQRRSTITSQQITKHIATSCSVTEPQAAAAIEALWTIITNSRHDYSGGRSPLEIPFFGQFRLVTGTLEFKSHTSSTFLAQASERARQRPQEQQRQLAAAQEAARQEQLQLLAGQIYHQHSRLPVSAMQATASTINKDAGRDHWSGVFSAVKAAAPTGDDSLSEVPFEQQLARATSESANVDLETALQLTWELIETLCAIMAHGKVSIRWARRGEMIPSRDSEDVTYQFRTYSTFGSTPSTSVPAKRTTASQLTRKTGSQTANRGCLASTLSLITYITYIALVVISVLALTIPLASGYQLLSSPPHKSGITWFTMLLGMAICVAPCRISYSATRSYWRQKRRR